MRRFGSKQPAAGLVLGAVALAVATLAACSSSSKPAAPPPRRRRAAPRVLLVGTFHGHAGQYATIQSAVNAARPGDWILVAPGDYHENADTTGPVSEYVAARRLRRRAHREAEHPPARHEPHRR